MKVMAVDLQRLRDCLEEHIATGRENGLNLSDPSLTYLDASNIQLEVLADVMLQQTQVVPSAATGPKPISAVSNKCTELSAEEIVRTGLKSIPEVLQKYPDLHTEAKMGALAVKLACEALFGDEVLKRCTPRGWQDLPALPQGQLNSMKTALWNQFPQYWTCPEAFERKWMEDAVAQACKRLRNLKK